MVGHKQLALIKYKILLYIHRCNIDFDSIYNFQPNVFYNLIQL